MRRWVTLALSATLAGPAAAQPADAPADEAAAATAEAPSPGLPEHPEVAAARKAYNEGRYNEAARSFLRVAQALPEAAGAYRALARARLYADDVEGAIIAYRVYLKLAPPEAGDRVKIEAELELAVRRVKTPPPEGPPATAAAALTGAVPRAKAGRFAGPDGAFGAIAAACEAGYLGAGLAAIRRDVGAELERLTTAALDAWWAPERTVSAAELSALEQGWRHRAEALGPAPNSGQAAALQGLHQLATGQHAKAAQTLAAVAPGDPRLRVAQAIALAQGGQRADALALLDALRHTAGGSESVTLLWALLARGEDGTAEATDALVELLEAP